MSGNNYIQQSGKDCEEVGNSIPAFNKKAIFKHLNVYGCSDESLSLVTSRFKVPKSRVVDYLNELLRRSEKYLHQECSSFCFDSIEAWLYILKKNNWLRPLETFAEYVAEIGSVEDLPEPKDIDGVHLRAAYRFIENGLLGAPQPALNTETTEFIVKEMEALIDAVNDEEGDKIAYAMYDKLEQYQILDLDPQTAKYDPFGLDI